MIRTKLANLTIVDVPDSWIFEYYLKLPSKLNGQNVTIKSVFNNEKTPSFKLYYSKVLNKYSFKCFSSGKSGTALGFVIEYYNLSLAEASYKIVRDYKTYVLENGIHISESYNLKYINLENHITRDWNKLDSEFWKSFGISYNNLLLHNVKPVESYTWSDGSVVEPGIAYGYYNSAGELLGIYKPLDKKKKFIRVKKERYTLGINQIQNLDYGIITSSLKDVMAFKELRIKNFDVIAPEAETMNDINPEDFSLFAKNKKKLFTLFDNDGPGKRVAETFKNLYGMEVINFNYSKDLSDTIKDFGIKSAKEFMVLELKKFF
jgi:DNA primase